MGAGDGIDGCGMVVPFHIVLALDQDLAVIDPSIVSTARTKNMVPLSSHILALGSFMRIGEYICDERVSAMFASFCL